MNKIFGREEIITTIKKRISGLIKGYRQNIALIGAARMGKTSLLRSILSDTQNCQVLPIYILLNANNPRQALRNMSIQILYSFLKSHDVEVNNDFTYLLEKSQAFIPKTVAKIKLIEHNLERKKINTAILEAFETTKIFFDETNKQSLFIIDEFHILGDIGGENIFSELGKIILTQKNTMYLIASSSVACAKDILSHGLSLLFGNFEVLEIKPYATSISDKFISTHLKAGLNDIYKKFLIDFTSGNPFYLNTLCREITIQAQIQKQDTVGKNGFIDAFENILFNEWGLLNQQFTKLLNYACTERKKEPCGDVLSAILEGRNKIKALAKYLNRSGKILQQRLSRFYDNGIIVKRGDSLYITDKILCFWLKFIYEKRQRFDYIDPEILRTDFRNALFRKIDLFASHLQKNIIERILELFNLFTNETIVIERKKITLSHFREIRLITKKGDNFDAVILAKSENTPWVIAIKKDTLMPFDIATFITQCRLYGQPRSQRRVIITLNEIDINAKLKALQEKIITWQRQDLNSLFKLYNRPDIFV